MELAVLSTSTDSHTFWSWVTHSSWSDHEESNPQASEKGCGLTGYRDTHPGLWKAPQGPRDPLPSGLRGQPSPALWEGHRPPSPRWVPLRAGPRDLRGLLGLQWCSVTISSPDHGERPRDTHGSQFPSCARGVGCYLRVATWQPSHSSRPNSSPMAAPKERTRRKPISTSLRRDLQRPMSFLPRLLSFPPIPPKPLSPGLGKGPELGAGPTENIRSCPELFSLWLLREQARCLQCLQSAISNVLTQRTATTESAQTSKEEKPQAEGLGAT